jgi:hypothetical protein
MLVSRSYEALLALPHGRAHGALRAGLMAMNVVPQPAPPDAQSLLAQLRTLDHDVRRVAFVDISSAQRLASGARPSEATDSPLAWAPSLIDLDHALPRGHSRARIFLTRLRGGHTSAADRRWVRKLGFGGLWAEFALDDDVATQYDHDDGTPDPHHRVEPGLHHALESVAAVLGTDPPTAATVRRHAGSPHGSLDQPARDLIRRLAHTSAEAAGATLAKRLRVRDRQYHLRTYPACFVGRSAVRAIAATFDVSSGHALEIGRALRALGLLAHVTHEHDFEDADYFYRLTISRRADAVGLGEALGVLLEGVHVDDRSWHAKSYPRCWIGTEGVDLLVGRLGLERHHAWIVLHRLMQFGAFDHVVAERPFIDGHFFYRFAPALDAALVSASRRGAALASTPGPLLPSW